MILITGGAGFIGSNFIIDWLGAPGQDEALVNVDRLTYAGNLENLAGVEHDSRYRFVRLDICERDRILELLRAQRPRAIVHFAAESHVDRSILGPGEFVRTNIEGTFSLLQAAHGYWGELDAPSRATFRFVHVSTDEVYGSLGPTDAPFREASAYQPNSPYSASKAASDHLVRAWHHTYGFPAITTNCSNNYGPYQFPEKLIPLVIANAIAGKPLPVYGDGTNVRDWLYVGDHCAALRSVLRSGRPGQTYNIGGGVEMANIDVVRAVCRLLDELRPDPAGPHERLVSYVTDRPGHDWRYAIDARKIAGELRWTPAESFASGIARTARWYLEHQSWVERVLSGAYKDWIATNYGGR
ncbi:MAG: dTDP-glucose 4,6-dehydratase [Burkholderiaceae bacterium]|nr:dTDP-glucose 4,6-dehydratase [Burkholderiaceae bacterium]